MLSFDLSAIDLILVLSVLLLLILYMTKLSGNPEVKKFNLERKKVLVAKKNLSVSQNEFTKCPRGFGNIKKFSDDYSVSDKCLGCHMIIECFSEKRQQPEHSVMDVDSST